jgi:hypothetical protein
MKTKNRKESQRKVDAKFDMSNIGATLGEKF